jgi:hypothetical protein
MYNLWTRVDIEQGLENNMRGIRLFSENFMDRTETGVMGFVAFLPLTRR